MDGTFARKSEQAALCHLAPFYKIELSFLHQEQLSFYAPERTSLYDISPKRNAESACT